MLELPSDLGSTGPHLQPHTPCTWEWSLLPIGLSSSRRLDQKQGKLFFSLDHTAKAYLEKHGVYPLTGLHSKFWVWVVWGIGGVINWQIVTVVKWWLYDFGHISSPLLILVTSSVKQGGWTVASGSFFELCDSTSRKMNLKSLWEPQFDNNLSFILPLQDKKSILYIL